MQDTQLSSDGSPQRGGLLSALMFFLRSGYYRVVQFLFVIVRKVISKPKLIIGGVFIAVICLVNFYISRFLSNELIVRTISPPALSLSKEVLPKNPPEEQTLGCFDIAAPLQNLMKAQSSPQISGTFNDYCVFFAENFNLTLVFPHGMPAAIPDSRLIKMSRGVVYTVLDNYVVNQIAFPTFKVEKHGCTVVAMVGKPVIASIVSDDSTFYTCGAAEGFEHWLVEGYMLKRA